MWSRYLSGAYSIWISSKGWRGETLRIWWPPRKRVFCLSPFMFLFICGNKQSLLASLPFSLIFLNDDEVPQGLVLPVHLTRTKNKTDGCHLLFLINGHNLKYFKVIHWPYVFVHCPCKQLSFVHRDGWFILSCENKCSSPLPYCFFFLADVMYNGEMNEKIKLLYKLHIPPGKKLERERIPQFPQKTLA